MLKCNNTNKIIRRKINTDTSNNNNEIRRWMMRD